MSSMTRCESNAEPRSQLLKALRREPRPNCLVKCLTSPTSLSRSHLDLPLALLFGILIYFCQTTPG